MVLSFSVQTGWSIPVELVVNQEMGIGYLTDRNGQVRRQLGFLDSLDLLWYLNFVF